MSAREDALAIWHAAVAAADPFEGVRAFLAAPDSPARKVLDGDGRILVCGGGKAGSVMASAVESALAGILDRVTGLVNVPGETERSLQSIETRGARPAGSNHPTAEGVAASEEQLALAASATANDLALCLLSGGGSALMPCPAVGVSLEDKQAVTRLLHACGATIDEMNCVRKHLSRVKGGRLAQAFAERNCPVISLIISDVIGDPLDVIASGPTAPDPTTFADAVAVLERFGLIDRTPAAVLDYLRRGAAGEIAETLKSLPACVSNVILANNARSLLASALAASERGYRVINLGSFIEGETRQAAVVMAGIVRGVLADGAPGSPPVCLLSGGETTVALGQKPGMGGRNQEFVLAMLAKLGAGGMENVVVLSGGTDGEDGPTDAAGAIADRDTLQNARSLGLDMRGYLERHDAYPFFAATGDLVKTGLTGTNVMDVRVVLVR